MAYAPPIGNAANFNFSVTPYTAPAGNAVNFDFESFDVSVAESASAASTQNATAILRPTVNETASAVDHPGANTVRRVSVTESASAVDHFGSVFPVVIAETLTATSTQNGSNVSTLSVVETAHAADTIINGIHLHVVETLTAVAHATAGVNGVWHLAVHEILAATDTPNRHNYVNASVVETAHAFVTLSESLNGTHNVTARGFADADDTVSAHLSTHSIVHETLTAHDSLGVEVGTPGVWHLAILENAHATDSATDPLTFTSTGVRFWGYGYYYQKVPGNVLSCWVAGLDCGDHAIDPNGSVFVPWQSDPDGLLTPTWLFNTHNTGLNSPDTLTNGYGASACNIDLHDNSNGLHRVVVDVAIGQCYPSEVQVLRPNSVELNHSQYGPSLAETRRLHQFGAQLVNAQGLSAGTNDDNLLPVEFLHPNESKYLDSEHFTGVHWGYLDDLYSYDGMLMLRMLRPHPATIAALIGFMKTMDRE